MEKEGKTDRNPKEKLKIGGKPNKTAGRKKNILLDKQRDGYLHPLSPRAL